MIDKTELWIIIFGLGLGSYFLRFVFIGLVGGRQMPAWVQRHLRYTAVAVLPALIVPQIVWPAATQGVIDPARLTAALVTLAVGLATRNVFAAILAGAISLFGMLYLLG